MRVVYVCSLDGGGPLSHMLGLAPAVAGLGIDVRVVCGDTRTASAFTDAGVAAVVVPMRHKLDLPAAFRLLPHLRGADVVHTNDRRAGLLARPTARLLGARVVHTVHGVPEGIAASVGDARAPRPPDTSRLAAAWQRHGYLRFEAAMARLGAVITPSHAMAAFLIAAGVPRRRLQVIPHGLDVRRTQVRARGDGVTVGVAARLEYWKGLDVLLDACARVPQRVQLEIFGDGSQRAELQRQAEALGLAARFHGHVTDVRPRLAEIDVFALPSRAENLPVAILEAMASALPVVATRVGGVAELVVDRETGLLVARDDVGGLAQAIGALAADPTLAAAYGRAGAARVARDFDPARIAARTAALYASLVATKPPALSPVRRRGQR